ncbi:UNVERIFIED_CONTAM: hypothetical protein K2H54_075198 [Gekko kuhli]
MINTHIHTHDTYAHIMLVTRLFITAHLIPPFIEAIRISQYLFRKKEKIHKTGTIHPFPPATLQEGISASLFFLLLWPLATQVVSRTSQCFKGGAHSVSSGHPPLPHRLCA